MSINRLIYLKGKNNERKPNKKISTVAHRNITFSLNVLLKNEKRQGEKKNQVCF